MQAESAPFTAIDAEITSLDNSCARIRGNPSFRPPNRACFVNEKEAKPPASPQTGSQPEQSWYQEFFKGVISFVGRLVRIIVALFLVFCLLVFIERRFDNGLVIDEFAIPETFQALGYTSDVFVQEITDQVDVANSNITTKNHSDHGLVHPANLNDFLSLQVPHTTLPVRSVRSLFHSLLGLPIASGEITMAACSVNTEGKPPPKNADGQIGKPPQRILMARRLTSLRRVAWTLRYDFNRTPN